MRYFMSMDKWLFFDCMETLVDLTELPKLRDYARWTYEGSGAEHVWSSFDSFFENYAEAKQRIAREIPENKEYEMFERMKLIAAIGLGDNLHGDINKTAQMLYVNYWRNYKSKCYVKKEVKEALEKLGRKYKLAVVSNFMVMDGIEELLEENDILGSFEFIVTSIKTGWRKPDVVIYNEALEKARVKAEDVIFIGDDYVNDYITPGGMGMRAVLLDRERKHCELSERVETFDQLNILLNLD
jgi:putative hydrolase of the HAD superfamily